MESINSRPQSPAIPPPAAAAPNPSHATDIKTQEAAQQRISAWEKDSNGNLSLSTETVIYWLTKEGDPEHNLNMLETLHALATFVNSNQTDRQ